MDLNKIFKLLLTMILIQTLSLKAQETTSKQYYDPSLKYVLPADSKVKINWVCPPLEDSVVRKHSIYALSFGVDLYNHPWIGFQHDMILNLVQKYQFNMSPNYENFVVMDNGSLLLATESDLGFVAPPSVKKGMSWNNRVTAYLQPISALPFKKCTIYSGTGNCLFLAGKNQKTDQFEIYLLKPEKTTAGTTIKQYEKIFSSANEFSGIAGDSENVYIANYNLIIKLNTKDNTITKLPVNSMSGAIRGLAYGPQAGLFYYADNGIGFIGKNSTIPFLSCQNPVLYVRGTTLFVLLGKTLGVLAFENIGDLKRFDKPIDETPITTIDDVKPTMIRLFEGPNPAQPMANRKYTSTFGRDTTRYIFGEVTLQNLLYQKKTHQQILAMHFKNRFGQEWLTQTYLLNFDITWPSYTTWFPMGSGDFGWFYPGDYTLVTYLNNIIIDERTFKVTGTPTIVEAAAHDDSLKIKELVLKGTDVNFKNLQGSSALMQIAGQRDLAITKLLIDHGADVNTRNNLGQSPLLVACAIYSDNFPTIKLLVDHGADVNAVDKDGETPLLSHLQNYNSSPEVVKLLLEHGANINAKNAKGLTPMTSLSMFSDELANSQIFELLIKKGADPNTKNQDGTLRIFDAVFVSNFPCLKTFIENGVNINAVGTNSATEYQEHSFLWSLLKKFRESVDENVKQQYIEIIDSVCHKGGNLTEKEEKNILQGPFWYPLPNQMIYEIIQNSDESVKDFVTDDPTLQKVIVKRLISLALAEIMKATSNYEYRVALDLCLKAKERAEQFKLMDTIPEVYYDMGLISINLEENNNAIQYLKNYLEVAPDGSLASKAKSLIRKLS